MTSNGPPPAGPPRAIPPAPPKSAPSATTKPKVQPPAPPPAAQARRTNFEVQKGKTRQARRIVLYGPGGVGKSTLAANLSKVGIKPLFLDLAHGTEDLDTDRVAIDTFSDVRDALASDDLWKSYSAVVLDTASDCQEAVSQWVIQNVPHEKPNKAIRSIEDYGFGKGYRHIYEASVKLLGDLDRHVRQGRHVVVIAHECISTVPNPDGEDFLRYEPRLQAGKSGEASVRHRLKEWCDDMFFINFDQHVGDDGKVVGSGTRTIYGNAMPTHWAKSRKVPEPVRFDSAEDATLWEKLFGE